ncbi:unnamed protein product [Cuscuta epithymum]|uniref:Uncharacterized protein n=1 Tax=Cuscuta epithymum TaxID=186058 RepID=A0AAV0EG85_9ASTE|nr:unnamed protein product [Cuscuta epithymum]
MLFTTVVSNFSLGFSRRQLLSYRGCNSMFWLCYWCFVSCPEKMFVVLYVTVRYSGLHSSREWINFDIVAPDETEPLDNPTDPNLPPLQSKKNKPSATAPLQGK